LAACLEVGSGPNNEVSKTFDGNKQLVLAAGYTPNAQSNGVGAWADVPVGTPAILEITGPLHIYCAAHFRAPDPNMMGRDNLAVLDVGDGGGALFASPAGGYTAILTIPSVPVSIQRSFSAGTSYPDTRTGVYDLNIGCVPVADTMQELQTLLQQHARAVQIWVNQMDPSTARFRLEALAESATQAVRARNTASALNAMSQIRDIAQPLGAQYPYYDILRDTLASIALLTRQPPSS
jgi:hypothetical protein